MKIREVLVCRVIHYRMAMEVVVDSSLRQRAYVKIRELLVCRVIHLRMAMEVVLMGRYYDVVHEGS